MHGRSRLGALIVVGAAVAGLAMTTASPAVARTPSAVPRPVLPVRVMHIISGGVTTTLTIRGNWHLGRLPRQFHPQPPRPRIVRPAAPGRLGQATSAAWGGYADSGTRTRFRFVAVNFNAPNVNCSTTPLGTSGADVAVWAGLDGFTGAHSTVEQDGYAYICDPVGNAQFFVWYEMFPALPVPLYGVVQPGDALHADVFYDSSTGKYTLDLTDLTQNGAGISATTKCARSPSPPCKNNSAEVIAEVNMGGPGAGEDLADFGQTDYTNASVTSSTGTKGGLGNNSAWQGTNITLIDPSNNNNKLATAGSLQGGTAYEESWLAPS